MPQALARTIVLLLLILMPAALDAKDPERQPKEEPAEEQDFWLSFVPGKYTFVGREPDRGASYAGEATIDNDGKGALVLRRSVAGKAVEARGAVEVPHPPGEGKVLRFRWQEGGKGKTMTCLVSGDLDNYARLSCVWTVDGSSPKAPGLEAYFSTEMWSE